MAGLAGWLAACASDPGAVAWTIAIDQSVQVEQRPTVGAWIAAGGCQGEERLYEAELGAGEPPAVPRAMPPGRYGFAAEARDDRCRAIAFGCVEKELPAQGSDTVHVVLRPIRPRAACPSWVCDESGCPGEPGSPGDERADASAQGPAVEADSSATDPGDAQGPEDCSDGKRREGGSCYRDYGLTVRFDAAEVLCAQAGGHPVVFDDEEEEQWVLEAFRPTDDLWLGLTDEAEEGVFITAAGLPARYFNWDQDASEPNGGRNSNCVRFHVSAQAWRDIACTTSQGLLCELP